MQFELGRDYFTPELEGRYDFDGYLFLSSMKIRGAWLSVLQFNFDRVVLKDQTARLEIAAVCDSGETFLLKSEAKFFAHVQSLTGFRYLAICMANVRSDAEQLWTKDGTKFEIVKLQLTDDVSEDVAGMKFNM